MGSKTRLTVVSAFLALTLILIGGFGVSASTTTNDKQWTNVKEIYGLLTDSSVKSNSTNSQIVPYGPLPDTYRFNILTERQFYTNPTRVSPYVENQTNNVSTYSIQYGTSESSSFSVTLTTEEKDAVSASVGYSVSTSYNWSETISVSISPYHRGWIEWKTSMTDYYGYIENTSKPWQDPKYLNAYVTNTFIDKNGDRRLDGAWILREEPL